MKGIRSLEAQTGRQWTGVAFHFDRAPTGALASRPTRFCEAITESYARSFVLPEELVMCPGARRSLGLSRFSVDDLIREMSTKTGVPPDRVGQILDNTARLDAPIAAVTVGKIDSPDVVVSYVRPRSAMNLVRRWQEIHGGNLRADLSTFMAVCGNGAVKAYKLGGICVSFGCPDSREYGRVGDDEMIIAMPYGLATLLFPEDRADTEEQPCRAAGGKYAQDTGP
jgi:uncharacterized protein (DUF169 family)